MTAHGIELDVDVIREFCRRWQICELSVFGSILRQDFGPDSDVDLLFDLEPGVELTIDSWIAMEEELQAMLGRAVDLVPRKDVERSPNYLRRNAILRSAEPLVGSR